MILISRVRTICKSCRRVINPGDSVEWQKGSRDVTHVDCHLKVLAQQSNYDASWAETSDKHFPAPPGKSYLPYQRAGIEFCLNHRGTLLADEMGLGKTIQAIGVINSDETIESVLIVCPKSLRLNWQLELKDWLVRPLSVALFPDDGDITIINYDLLDDLTITHSWDLFIQDEAHYTKNPNSLRSKRVRKIERKYCSKRILLTGSPILNCPQELFPLLQTVDPRNWDPAGTVTVKTKQGSEERQVGIGEGAGRWTFLRRYCDAKKVEFWKTDPETKKKTKITKWDFTGASNLDELGKKLRNTCMIRRLKKDVLKEIPPKRRQLIVLAVPDEAKDVVKQTNKEFSTMGMSYEQAINHLENQKVPFEKLSELRHQTALLKVPQVVSHIKQCLESVDKIVVWAHHSDVIYQIANKIPDSLTLVGADSERERQNVVELFQNDKHHRVFIGSIKAAGVGLTLTAASHHIFAESDWVSEILKQAEDRSHRIGQTLPLLAQHLVFDGSIDANMLKLVLAKQDLIDRALDSRETTP